MNLSRLRQKFPQFEFVEMLGPIGLHAGKVYTAETYKPKAFYTWLNQHQSGTVLMYEMNSYHVRFNGYDMVLKSILQRLNGY